VPAFQAAPAITATSPVEKPQFARVRDPERKLTDVFNLIENKDNFSKTAKA